MHDDLYTTEHPDLHHSQQANVALSVKPENVTYCRGCRERYRNYSVTNRKLVDKFDNRSLSRSPNPRALIIAIIVNTMQSMHEAQHYKEGVALSGTVIREGRELENEIKAIRDEIRQVKTLLDTSRQR